VLLDRPSYTAPSVIQLTVFDPAKTASNMVSVLLKSTTELAGENFVLHSAGSYGALTGAVATVVGPATVDGQLEIHEGDTIEADYGDNAGTIRVATAAADLLPPALSGVTATIDLGVITITWQTTEPASSIVRYGTNLTFSLAVTNSALVTSHSVRLTKLVPGKTYFSRPNSPTCKHSRWSSGGQSTTQTNLPYVIQVSSNLSVWTSLYTNLAGGKRDWLDSEAAHSTRRFYRTLGFPSSATNLHGRTPVTDWLQASGSPMSYTTTNANQGSHIYRVEVRP
jgi:hypothetical protein